MKILVINAGSSSLKFQLINMVDESVMAKGICEKIGSHDSFIKFKNSKEEVKNTVSIENHKVAVELVLSSLVDKKIGVISSLDEVSAVGHRVVHGGELFKDSAIITSDVLKSIEDLIPLAPLHNPGNLIGIKACQEAMPSLKQVAVFDTSFHSGMPKEAFLYAVDYNLYKEDKVRRYGFHGTSHKFVANEVARLMNKDIKDLKIITVHLGNGASVSAVKNGISVDTSMGFTPLEGLMMGTRSGDIDASVVGFIAEKYGFSGNEVVDYLNKKAGILGVSGISNDMRDIMKADKEGDERAKLIVPMMAYRVKKYIGSYACAMGGVDAIVFTATIGELQDDLRDLALQSLEFMGIELDVEKNYNIPRGTNEEISKPNSSVKVFRIPTNEELVIARDTLNLIK